MKINDILGICNGTLLCGDINISCENFSKDTRTIKSGDIYVGIKGETFDGNSFFETAFNNGAIACILDKAYESNIDLEKVKDKTIVLVDDTILSLGKLAEYKLNQYNIPVIAVTGSVGKTSTRDMIYSVMKKKFNVLKTEGNYNNDIGLPLTILELKNHNAILLEMGMNHLGEISYLSKIAKPDIAVINTIAPAHIGILGSMENILKAKLEILDGLKENGTLIINNDNEYLHNAEISVDKYTYGIHNDSNLIATDIKFKNDKAYYQVNIDNMNVEFTCSINTENYILNSLAAIAVGLKLNISISDIRDGLADFKITGSRLERIETTNGITLINDAYNASLDSMKNAIDYLLNSKGKRKIAILGDIFELGDFSKYYHEQVGEYISDKNIDYLITVGNDAKYIYDSAINHGFGNNKSSYFKTKEDCYEFLKTFLQKENTVIVKASNGMNFIDIVDFIKNMNV